MLRPHLWTLAIFAAMLAAGGTAPAASTSVSVAATVPETVALGMGGCLPNVAGSTDFGTLASGTSTIGTADCHVTWSTNAATAMLRISQTDGTGSTLTTGAGSIPDYDEGASDWTVGTGHFGACLRAVGPTTVASWSVAGSCTATDGSTWQGIPAAVSDLSSRVASSDSNGEVRIRFGIRTGTSASGSYSAGITFEVIAPDPGPGAAPTAGSATVTGSAAIGQTLSASTAGWNLGNPPGSYEYQWVRCGTGGGTCIDIAGQTGSTYIVTGSDGGRTLRVRVSVSNAYGTATATSPQSGIVADTIGNEGGTSATTVSNASQLTVSRPANAFEGDVLVAQVVVRDGTDVVFTTVPAGWTLIRRTDNTDRVAMASYRKVLTAAEPAGYTWQWNVSDRATIGVQAFSSVDPTTPVSVSSGVWGGSATATTTGVSVPDADSALLALYGTRDTLTFTDNSGMSPLWQLAGGGGNVGAFGRWQPVGTGATGTRSASLSLSSDWAAQMITLKPRP